MLHPLYDITFIKSVVPNFEAKSKITIQNSQNLNCKLCLQPVIVTMAVRWFILLRNLPVRRIPSGFGDWWTPAHSIFFCLYWGRIFGGEKRVLKILGEKKNIWGRKIKNKFYSPKCVFTQPSWARAAGEKIGIFSFTVRFSTFSEIISERENAEKRT